MLFLLLPSLHHMPVLGAKVVVKCSCLCQAQPNGAEESVHSSRSCLNPTKMSHPINQEKSFETHAGSRREGGTGRRVQPLP